LLTEEREEQPHFYFMPGGLADSAKSRLASSAKVCLADSAKSRHASSAKVRRADLARSSRAEVARSRLADFTKSRHADLAKSRIAELASEAGENNKQQNHRLESNIQPTASGGTGSYKKTLPSGLENRRKYPLESIELRGRAEWKV
jgi:hypothetical protein